MAAYPQSTAYTRMFNAYLASDHVTAATGLTIVVTLSKAGGAYAAAGGTVTEISNGLYKIALTTTDTNTVGDLAIRGAVATMDDVKFVDQVTDPIRGLGAPTALPDVAAGANGGLPLGDASGRVDLGKALGTAVTLDTNNVLNVSAKYLAGTALTGRDIGANVLLSNGTGTGQLKLASGYVAMTWADIAAPTTTVALTGTTVGTLTTYTGNTPQTGDAYSRLGLNGVGLTNLGDTRIANLDAAVSTRSTYAGGDTAGTTTLLGRLSAARAGYLDNLSAGAVALASSVPANFSALAISAAGNVSADMKKINGTTVNGDGSGTPWGP